MQETAERFTAGDQDVRSYQDPPSPAFPRAQGARTGAAYGEALSVLGEGETYVKKIKDVPVFDGTKAKFPSLEALCLVKIFAKGIDVSVADEGLSFPAFQQSLPTEDIQKNLLVWITQRHSEAR